MDTPREAELQKKLTEALQREAKLKKQLEQFAQRIRTWHERGAPRMMAITEEMLGAAGKSKTGGRPPARSDGA